MADPRPLRKKALCQGRASARRPRINVRLRYFRSNLFTYRQRGCLDNASCNARSEESGEILVQRGSWLDSKTDSYCNHTSCRGTILTAAATNIVEADTIVKVLKELGFRKTSGVVSS